jgi:hypothetical protein
MVSRREEVLEAVRALIAAALPAAKVERNAAKPERIQAGGLVIIRDGDPGDPEVTLSPLTYIYTHRIPVEIAVLASAAPLTPAQALDATLVAIGTAVEADRTLGGLCDFLEPEAPSTDDLEASGTVAGRWADAVILATYATSNPLT